VCPGLEPALVEFTPAFALQSPEDFVEHVLVKLGAKVVMVGANFRFGRGRTGNLETLRHLGSEAGFRVHPTELEGDDDGAWSSTRVRAQIEEGNMQGARSILGRPHMLSGEVRRGDQRGRELGFPTCNIVDFAEARPPHGVYAVLIDRVDADGRAKTLGKGVANLGVRPTIGDGLSAVLETHIFDFDEDVYGRTLRVHVVARLRGEQKFDGLNALRAQIARDSANARDALASEVPDPAAAGAWG
jgi:riboflavin kinase/FMN adenylyltransferase